MSAAGLVLLWGYKKAGAWPRLPFLCCQDCLKVTTYTKFEHWTVILRQEQHFGIAHV